MGIKANIKGDARTFIAKSLKHFSDYFTNRYCRIYSATADDISIISMDCDVVVNSDNAITVDGVDLTLPVWGSDGTPRYNCIDYLGDGIYAYFQL